MIWTDRVALLVFIIVAALSSAASGAPMPGAGGLSLNLLTRRPSERDRHEADLCARVSHFLATAQRLRTCRRACTVMGLRMGAPKS
jgi:hypothetical protein